MIEPIPADADSAARAGQYARVRESLASLLEGEDDWVAAMATAVCELHHAFGHFDWTGFYRARAPERLVIGPYQGTHGCLRIDDFRGVCGAAARDRATVRVDDVSSFPGHIACSASTRSEIVVPVLAPAGSLLAVLDIDSDRAEAFTATDAAHLEAICADLGRHFAGAEP